MNWYQKLSLPIKIGLLAISLILTNLLLYAAPVHFSFITFVFIFVSLYLIFNLFQMKLYSKIFIGLGLGVIGGLFWGDSIDIFQPVGRAFILLIKMIVVPLVFASLLVGTASIGNIKKLGRIGLRTFTFYIISTALAITIGLSIANLVKPGSNIPSEIRDELHEDYAAAAQEKVAQSLKKPSTIDLLLDIIPENPARALADGRMLQIIFFAIICGLATTYLKNDRRDILLGFFNSVTDISIHIVHMIMKLAPYGVFALIAYVIGQYGSNIIITLFSYFATTMLALFVHVVLFNTVVIYYLTKTSVAEFWKGIYQALIVAFSTSSSSATLPVTMDCAEKNLNVRPEISSFVLPLGATINMDGTAIFQGVSAIFIATIYGMELTLVDQMTIILTATLASIGTAGAPQVGIIMLTMVLQSIGIPVEGIALILGVERFLDMSRTTVNVTSDLSCAAMINRFEQ
jgi:Na+/H+-dicarboxylate symporter